METGRLRMARVAPEEAEEYSRLNADPEVMKYLPKVLDRKQSDESHVRLMNAIGFYTVREVATGEYMGICGLFDRPKEDFNVAFAPCVEIGWRFHKKFWNQGYGTEAAKAVLAWGFDEVGLEEIVSFTVPTNLPSRRVMQKIGLVHYPEWDFDHPNLEPGHPLTHHVCYRLLRSEWIKMAAAADTLRD